ncbi:MAG TPA: AIR synthase-related protein [Nannocystaceae bacterium]|nr:AIR synthase-related protein [Nannocystaceae bacterium]
MRRGWRLEIEVRPHVRDALAAASAARFSAWLGIVPSELRTRKVFHLDLGIDEVEAERVLGALVDPVAERGALGMLPDDWPTPPVALTVGFGAGVTDTVGATVKRAAEDCLGRRLDGAAYSSTMYLVWGLSTEEVERAARELLYNPLIQRARIEAMPRVLDLTVPRAGADVDAEVRTVALTHASDEELKRISESGLLALSLLEMQAIAAHFRGVGREPTDAELECLAQTWSEHCKHKIFAAPIEMKEGEGTRLVERGLFRTFVRGATEQIAAERIASGRDTADAPWLVSVFHDNAGVVRFSPEDHLVYKVETHNSPSALDPYGGAMTGIVGVNRDSFGTGRGADLLTNVWGYCFGDPRHDRPLPAGLMHPRRIRDGVHHGVIDGGNQAGIPMSRGFELFDARYLGKPLVFCGTVALMPVTTANRPTHEKYAQPGDAIVMVGGRIGKDGIHGATFSSQRLDETAPVQAVQIGDPITQKMMFDMLAVARDKGLFSAMTDNGAGGLSSSVGEMATATGGARLDLARAPLKYPGLQPWEVLISEAQERMTLAVPPGRLAALLALARDYEVEATVLGEFTDSGRFEVRWGDRLVADLPLALLHDGVPLPALHAELASPPIEIAPPERALDETLLALLATPEQASAQVLVRHYDHEVKGLSVVKPLVGTRRNVPSTATVLRGRHHRREGVVLGEGIHPFYSELDAHAMAHACVDEAVRRVLCAGARIDRLAALDNFCWPDPVKSDRTPDGAHKLAQLVRCCEGLFEACVAHGMPLVSGKDSMKNDAWIGGVKISIPPTLLVSVMGQLDDVDRALDLVPPADSDLWLLGWTHDELGGSAVLRMQGVHHAGEVPRTDAPVFAARYAAFVAARDAGLVLAAHAPGRGGLAIALSHLALASELTIAVDLARVAPTLSPFVALFSESTGRILFAARAADRSAITAALGDHGAVRIGETFDGTPGLRLQSADQLLAVLSLAQLRDGFTSSDVAV